MYLTVSYLKENTQYKKVIISILESIYKKLMHYIVFRNNDIV